MKTWIHRYQKTGDVHNNEKQGRKRKTSEREDLDIISKAIKQRTSTLADISMSMSTQGTEISYDIVRC